MRLRITLKRSFLQQEDILNPAIQSAIISYICADNTDWRGGKQIVEECFETVVPEVLDISAKFNGHNSV
jgi:hypothetical protein